jgi:D-alanyl-D-alanine carboxypeptidase
MRRVIRHSVLVGITLLLFSSSLGFDACGRGKGVSLNSCPLLPTTTSPAGSIASIVDPLVAGEMQAQGLVGMSVAVAKNGTILYAQGYGYADLSACKTVQPSTVFQIGSVTKQFTAAAVLELQTARKLDIDQTVSTYLPTYGFDPRITLRMLLNQTSGLMDYLNDLLVPDSWYNGVPEQTVLATIAHQKLKFAPGSSYSYSNSNYFILGSIIESVTGVTYSNYMVSNIFAPAGLSFTSYLQPPASASPYNHGPSQGSVPDASLYFSAGNLWSSVEDLAIWDAALLNGKVIPASLFKVMVTPSSVPVAGTDVPSDYAMGWQVSPELGHTLISHNGMTTSYTAFNGVFLDDGFSVSVLTNMRVNDNSALSNFGEQLIHGICTASSTAGNC